MSLKLIGWALIILSLVVSAPLLASLLGRRLAKERLLDAPLTFFSHVHLSASAFRGAAGTLIATAAVFLFIAGVGAATSFVRVAPQASGAEETDDQVLARLEDYARSVGPEKKQAAAQASADLLPDVNTMIERLATRLKAAPQDVQGWRMLGWSYFNTGSYKQATAAYAKAVELDPSSAEVKRAYEDAKAKASGGGSSKEDSTQSNAANALASDATPAHAAPLPQPNLNSTP